MPDTAIPVSIRTRSASGSTTSPGGPFGVDGYAPTFPGRALDGTAPTGADRFVKERSPT